MSPYTSLRFMATLHETGLRMNPSTTSNCAQKTNSVGWEKAGEIRWPNMFLGILKHQCVASEYGRDEDLQLHVRQGLTHARPVIRDDRVVDSLASGTRSTVSLT